MYNNYYFIILDENGFKFGLGILEPNAGEELDEESVGYFAAVENDDELVGAQRSDSYSSVKEGKQLTAYDCHRTIFKNC